MNKKTEEERETKVHDLREPTLEEVKEALNNVLTDNEDLCNELGLLKTENERLAKVNEELQKAINEPEALKNKINECQTLKTNLENLIRATAEERDRYLGVLRFLNDPTNSMEQKKNMVQSELAKHSGAPVTGKPESAATE